MSDELRISYSTSQKDAPWDGKNIWAAPLRWIEGELEHGAWWRKLGFRAVLKPASLDRVVI
jgi:hypothetical protein